MVELEGREGHMSSIPFKKIVVRNFGGAEVLELAQDELAAPNSGYARVKVSAAGVGYTDIMARKASIFGNAERL